MVVEMPPPPPPESTYGQWRPLGEAASLRCLGFCLRYKTRARVVGGDDAALITPRIQGPRQGVQVDKDRIASDSFAERSPWKVASARRRLSSFVKI